LLPFLAKTEKDRRHLLLREGFKSLLDDGARFATSLTPAGGSPCSTCQLNAHLILLAVLISRISLHSTATRGGESFIYQSDARVLSGRERDYATIENPSRRHPRFRGTILGGADQADSRLSFVVPLLELILGDFATTEILGSMSRLPKRNPETSQLLSRARSFV
jgi:hypothetical protein